MLLVCRQTVLLKQIQMISFIKPDRRLLFMFGRWFLKRMFGLCDSLVLCICVYYSVIICENLSVCLSQHQSYCITKLLSFRFFLSAHIQTNTHRAWKTLRSFLFQASCIQSAVLAKCVCLCLCVWSLLQLCSDLWIILEMAGECVLEGPDPKEMSEEALWELINDNRHRISLGVRPCILIPYLRQVRVLTEVDEDEILSCHNLTNRCMRTSESASFLLLVTFCSNI